MSYNNKYLINKLLRPLGYLFWTRTSLNVTNIGIYEISKLNNLHRIVLCIEILTWNELMIRINPIRMQERRQWKKVAKEIAEKEKRKYEN